MRNIDTALDYEGVTKIVRHPGTIARARVNDHHTHLVQFRPDAWTWRELRDYVVDQIEQRGGSSARSVEQEAGIFKAFATRWGTEAPEIARYAFDVADGVWNGESIGITRFCKGSDPYFAVVIAERIRACRA